MAWLAVDKDGAEVILKNKPKRNSNAEFWEDIETEDYTYTCFFDIDLPKGTIEKIIGKKLTWEDEPVEI